METANTTLGETYYSNLSSTRSDLPSEFDDGLTSPNEKGAYLPGNGFAQTYIGPAMTLKVMAGDKFNVRVSSFWKSGTAPGTPVNPISSLIAALNSSIGTVSGGHGTPTELATSNVLDAGATSFLNSQSYNSSLPKAYLNWILFDEQFNYITSGSGFDQVGSNGNIKTHSFNDMPISKSGYLYIFVSNASPEIDVWFDNLQVTHIKGPLLQEDHYYPFGLTMQGISSQAASFGKTNDYKFNGGVELENAFNVNTYSTFFRTYDQQLGRFTGIDILAESFSFINPYQFGYNNPITYNDPLGAMNSASTGRMQKGPDGNYHAGWMTKLLWGNEGFFGAEEMGMEGGGGNGGSGVYYNMMGLSSTWVLSQMNFGDKFGRNRDGEYGFWSKTSGYWIDNGYYNGQEKVHDEYVAGGRQFTRIDSYGYVLKELCGSYSWKKIGDSYNAQIDGLYLEATPDIGSKNPDPRIYINFSSVCVTLPAYPKGANVNPKYNINPEKATQILNNAWNEALVNINRRMNAGTLRFENNVRGEFLKEVQANLQDYHSRAKFTPYNGCSGSVPSSKAQYCDTIRF